jgi:hypothetical protein
MRVRAIQCATAPIAPTPTAACPADPARHARTNVHGSTPIK